MRAEAMIAISSGFAPFSASAVCAIACFHEAAWCLPSTLMSGCVRRYSLFTKWKSSRPWSHIQVEFTSLFSRGDWRKTSFSREPISVLQPRPHLVQMLLVSLRNHTRIWKRKSFAVSAPTGQMSTVLSE